MSKGLLAHWRRGILGRGITGALLLAVPVITAAVIGFSGGFGSVAGGLSELATGPDATFTAAPAATNLNTAIVAAAGGPGAAGSRDDRRVQVGRRRRRREGRVRAGGQLREAAGDAAEAPAEADHGSRDDGHRQQQRPGDPTAENSPAPMRKQSFTH